MLIAVTGATGFVGRYIVRQLVSSGHRVRCWHRPSSDLSGFEHFQHAIEWLLGSLGDDQATQALVRDVDAVVHAAVEWQGPRARVPAASHNLPIHFEQNLIGSLKLMRAAHEGKVGRFVFVSSGSVHEVILPDRPLDETHPTWPMNHYGAHKAAIEKFVHSYGFGQGWAICSVRPTGVYGVDHPASKSRWFELVGKVVRGEAIASAAGGKEVHAADVARACELLIHADVKTIAGQAYECYDRYIAEQDVARIAREITGSASPIQDLNKGPKNQIDTTKIRKLGMTFGGEGLLRKTVEQLVEALQ